MGPVFSTETGAQRPPNLSFGLPEFGWYHFAAAPYCAIYLCMRESVEAMYIYVAVREHLAFVRVRSIL